MPRVMLLARPRRLFGHGYDLLSGEGEAVGSLDLSPSWDGASLVLRGQRYGVALDHGSRHWLLRDGAQVVFEASRPPAIANRLLFTVKGAVLEIAPQDRGLRRFAVVGPDWAALGTIRRRGLLGRQVQADLSPLIPELAQHFLVFCAVIIARGLVKD